MEIHRDAPGKTLNGVAGKDVYINVYIKIHTHTYMCRLFN
jgi:hypothetical protein